MIHPRWRMRIYLAHVKAYAITAKSWKYQNLFLVILLSLSLSCFSRVSPSVQIAAWCRNVWDAATNSIQLRGGSGVAIMVITLGTLVPRQAPRAARSVYRVDDSMERVRSRRFWIIRRVVSADLTTRRHRPSQSLLRFHPPCNLPRNDNERCGREGRLSSRREN